MIEHDDGTVFIGRVARVSCVLNINECGSVGRSVGIDDTNSILREFCFCFCSEYSNFGIVCACISICGCACLRFLCRLCNSDLFHYFYIDFVICFFFFQNIQLSRLYFHGIECKAKKNHSIVKI